MLNQVILLLFLPLPDLLIYNHLLLFVKRYFTSKGVETFADYNGETTDASPEPARRIERGEFIPKLRCDKRGAV